MVVAGLTRTARRMTAVVPASGAGGSRSNPAQYEHNVGCPERVNTFDITAVPTHDGVNRPADRKADRL
jgi:hypothetical protein